MAQFYTLARKVEPPSMGTKGHPELHILACGQKIHRRREAALARK
jgi:hypothetical protein